MSYVAESYSEPSLSWITGGYVFGGAAEPFFLDGDGIYRLEAVLTHGNGCFDIYKEERSEENEDHD